MKSAPDSAFGPETIQRMAPPAAPMPMPEQVIERKRRAVSFLAWLALPFIAR